MRWCRIHRTQQDHRLLRLALRAPGPAKARVTEPSKYGKSSVCSIRDPRSALADTTHRSKELASGVCTARCYAHQPLGSATTLGRGFPHSCGDEAFRLKTVKSCVQRSDRTGLPCGAFDFSADRSPIGVFAKTRRSREDQVFELANHLNHIVIYMAGRRSTRILIEIEICKHTRTVRQRSDRPGEWSILPSI